MVDTDPVGYPQSLSRGLAKDVKVMGCRWWRTWTADSIIDMAKVPGFLVALAGITEVLQEGTDPDWVVGGESAGAAFKVAQEWLDVGVEPAEVGDWLRAGCWDPKAARRMVDAGLRPGRLLDDGKPAHLLDVGPEGDVPLAMAVADSYISVDEAVRIVTRGPDYANRG